MQSKIYLWAKHFPSKHKGVENKEQALPQKSRDTSSDLDSSAAPSEHKKIRKFSLYQNIN